MKIPNRLKYLLLAVCVALLPATTASAQGDAQDSVIAVSSSELPPEVAASWSNGDVTLSVKAGTTVVVLGFMEEPMVKVDASGRSFANLNSVSWLTNNGLVPPSSLKDEPEWSFIGDSPLKFHDHRIHFMASLPKNATPGDVLQDWKLPMLINDVPFSATGQLLLTTPPRSAPGSSQVLALGGVLLLLAAGAIYVLRLKKKRT
jgi:hypothetical protein